VTTIRIRRKQKSGTHFEQVPLAVVKRIAGGNVSGNGKAGTANSSVEPKSAQRDGVPARSMQKERR
jgi:hypothetical protein